MCVYGDVHFVRRADPAKCDKEWSGMTRVNISMPHKKSQGYRDRD